MRNLKALEGQWYMHLWSRETFCVIGVDEDFGVVDIRDENGDVDEFEFDEWEAMDLEVCAAPPMLATNGLIIDDPELDDYEPTNGHDATVQPSPRLRN